MPTKEMKLINLDEVSESKGSCKNIMILAPASSIHTLRWVQSLSENGHNISLVSMHEPLVRLQGENIKQHRLRWRAPFGYILNFWALKKLLKQECPDILHVHFASGYGTLGTLSGFSPRILSVWGTDVFGFIEKSQFHRMLITYNLKKAHWICSTSWVMAKQVVKLFRPAEGKLTVVPFGVDLEVFKPLKTKDKATEVISIGTVKTLEAKYGVDILIKGFALAKKKLEEKGSPCAHKIKLILYGKGSKENSLKALSRRLGIDKSTMFMGLQPHKKVPQALGALDIYVAMSREESFGVAVIEASACEVPVVVSCVGGLPEVVDDGLTGFIVQENTPEALSQKLVALVENESLRLKMGAEGRKKVESLYSWNKNVHLMERVYEHQLSKS